MTGVKMMCERSEHVQNELFPAVPHDIVPSRLALLSYVVLSHFHSPSYVVEVKNLER